MSQQLVLLIGENKETTINKNGDT